MLMIFTPVNMISHQNVVSVWPFQSQALGLKELVSGSGLRFIYIMWKSTRGKGIRRWWSFTFSLCNWWGRDIFSGNKCTIIGMLSGYVTIWRWWCWWGWGWIWRQRGISRFSIRILGGHLWPRRDRSGQRFSTWERLSE